MSRSRTFCVTDYELNEEFWTNLPDGQKIKYMIVGREVCPSTGKKHLQCYVAFATQRTLVSVLKIMKPRHVEIAKASDFKNKEYCEKEKDLVIEYGKPNEHGKRHDLDGVMEMVKDNKPLQEIVIEHGVQFIKYHRGIERVIEIVNPQPKRDWVTEVVVLWGESGTGKTRMAIEEGGEIISFTPNGFVIGYNNQEKIIWDDFDCENMSRQRFLTLTDRYAVRIDKKNCVDGIEWNPKVIYITSNFDPAFWYLGDKAVQRRLTRVIQIK